MIVWRHQRFFKISLDINENKNDAQKISRYIEFRAEHRQAGIGILNYFSKFLTERYPNVSVKVTIEQEDNKVRMIVEAMDGSIETVEQTLEEYALIISGKASPSDFLSDRYQIMELNQKLEMAAMEIRWQSRFITALEQDKNNQRELFVKQIEHLHQSVALGITNSTSLVKALDNLIRRPAIDPSVSAAIERISCSFRETRQPDQTRIKKELEIIARKSPSMLRDIYQICADTATGAAGNLIANWIQPLLGVLPH